MKNVFDNFFKKELELIKDKQLKTEVVHLLTKVPEYFWYIPASSTGKYHPTFALGEGGLYRHTRAAVKVAQNLYPVWEIENKDANFDLAVAALIFHDTFKQGTDGETGHTVHEHPLLAAQFVATNMSAPYGQEVAKAISSHMGQWTTSKYSDVVLPKPETNLQKFVHLCDYIASRKDFDIHLEEE